MCIFFFINQRTRFLLCHFQGGKLDLKIKKSFKKSFNLKITSAQIALWTRFLHILYNSTKLSFYWNFKSFAQCLHRIEGKNCQKNRQRSIIFLYLRNCFLEKYHQYKNCLIVMNFVHLLKRNCNKVLWNFKSFRKHLWKLKRNKCPKMRKNWL